MSENRGKVIVGLTGAFGSGKSTVDHLVEELGACVVDADRLAHETLWPGNPAYEKIESLFPEARRADGSGPDPKKIAEIVFKDAARRGKLEAIVHPYVFSRMEEEIAEAEEKVVVLEIPLLFETGMDSFCDVTVAVTADETLIRERLLEKGYSAQEIEARQKAQLPASEKAKRAKKVIMNSGTLKETRREVEKVWKDLHPVFKGDPKGNA